MVSLHRHFSNVDYGLRLPRPISYVMTAGSVAITVGIGYRATRPHKRGIATGLIGLGTTALVPGLMLLGFVGVLQAARNHLIGKIVGDVKWRGDEQVLDVGTGSGVLLIACAKQLDTGRATGIDIYDPNAGGGSADLFWRNAQTEGVSERVELHTMDARAMTFADATFDVAVSSLAMHHMGGSEDRQRAMAEMVRTLKKSGKIAVCDIAHVLNDCEQALRQHGMINVQRRSFLHVFSVLTAEKS